MYNGGASIRSVLQVKMALNLPNLKHFMISNRVYGSTSDVPLPGRAAAAYRAGANLAPERAVGRRTWEEFLRERVGG